MIERRSTRRALALGVIGLVMVGAAAGYAHWFSLQPIKSFARRLGELPPSTLVLREGDVIPPSAVAFPRLSDGVEVDIANLPKPLFVTYWAGWCSPCLSELKDLRDSNAELTAAGLTVVAIAVDSPENIVELAKQMELPFQVLIAEDPPVMPLSIFGAKQFAIPLSVVVGSDGRIREIVRGALSPKGFEEFMQDVRHGL